MPSCMNATYGWMNNPDGLSPCDVYDTLLSACDGLACDSTTSAITKQARAANAPSSIASENPCFCNTVSYSVKAACELCTGVDVQTLHQYTADQCGPNDGGIYITFPCHNTDVIVPSWALQSWQNETFNVTLASQIAQAAETAASTHEFSATPPMAMTPSFSIGETSALNSQSVSSNAQSIGNAPTSAVSTRTDAPRPNGHSGSRSPRDVGPIIGGVGAATLIGLASVLAICFVRRRCCCRGDAVVRKRRPSTSDKNEGRGAFTGSHDQPRDDRTSSVQAPLFNFGLKLYDPDDPSTYPPSLPEILGETRRPTIPELRDIFQNPA
ncbi:hypothetical protein C8Q70DRAFT_479143 [Cubamyces menziesii]|nr:hypothetical protein C8Q70DRAFT_479143 [Cubamyces menziesii]